MEPAALAWIFSGLGSKRRILRKLAERALAMPKLGSNHDFSVVWLIEAVVPDSNQRLALSRVASQRRAIPHTVRSFSKLVPTPARRQLYMGGVLRWLASVPALALCACVGSANYDGDDTDASTGAAMHDAQSPVVEVGGVPEGEPYCEPVGTWQLQWAEREREMLELVNAQRAEGADCGTEGVFDAAGPLEMQPALRCSARVHSLDMVERDYFAHDDPDGVSAFVRMRRAGYEGDHMAENIAAGKWNPTATLKQWMDSDAHCSAVMEPNFTHVGIGHRPGGRWYYVWTQNFGADRPPRD